jgi:RimJ/RimL family protein N-acetyltransferase
MVDYFHDADNDYLALLGADRAKFPTRSAWEHLVRDDMPKPLADREFHYLVWKVDGRAIGHCNINKIDFGHHAFLHLHMWEPQTRGRGVGTRLLSQSADEFIRLFELNAIYSEPNAFNPAPNRTMARVGFELERTYETTPGWINVRQTVNRWCLRADGNGPTSDG